jgi:hypothetical protein
VIHMDSNSSMSDWINGWIKMLTCILKKTICQRKSEKKQKITGGSICYK